MLINYGAMIPNPKVMGGDDKGNCYDAAGKPIPCEIEVVSSLGKKKLPGWVIPVAVGGGVLVLGAVLSAMRRR